MAEVKSFSELFEKLKTVADQSLEKDVAEKSVDLMKKRIQTDVYDAYPEPKDYRRSGDLKKAISTAYFGNVLYLSNTRVDVNDIGAGYKYLVPIIETGKGYTWGEGKLDDIIGARPFNQNTHDDLKNGKFKEFLSESLEAKGFKVR